MAFFYGAKKFRPNKFGNKSSKCLSKHYHPSILEAGVCNRLLAMRQAKEILSYQCQYKVELRVNGRHIANHYVDFAVFYPSSKMEFWEAKGAETEVWRMKRKLTEATIPEVSYRVIKREEHSWRSRS